MSYINQRKYLGAKFKGIYKPIAVTYDANAQAYFNVNTAITSTADKNAINTFYLGLKTDGIYSKIKAMYFPIWLTASNCKWNLVNPLDTNGAYRLTFSTGFTFASNGMLPNGVSSYADTFLSPNSAFAVDHNKHLSFYSQTDANTTNASSSIGSDNASAGWCRISAKSQGSTSMVYGGTNGLRSLSNTNSTGFYIGVRSSSTTSEMYKNGSLFFNGNSNIGSTSQISQSLLICSARSNLSIVYYDNKKCCFASIGDSLTNTEATNFSNRVNTLMTYFGINTY